jgi:hypothetical protein
MVPKNITTRRHMSIDHLFTRIDTQAIYPPLMRAARDMIAALEAKGHVYYAISGHRDVAHQNELYAKGRTTRGPRVTNARGGHPRPPSPKPRTWRGSTPADGR